MKKYIFEGVDGTGKTTEAKKIGGKYIHNKLIPQNYRDILNGITDDFYFLDDGANDIIVMDRSFIISEYFYSMFMPKRKVYLTYDFLFDFLNELEKRNILLYIHYYSKDLTLYTGKTLKTEEEYKNRRYIEKINNEYYKIFSILQKDFKNIKLCSIESILIEVL